jgi:acyl-ACP thioesterase
MYQYTTRIGFSQIDSRGQLRPEAIVNLFQDCANFHSLNQGATLNYFESQKKVWILSAWQIVIDRDLTMGDEVEVATSAYEFTSMFGMRNFYLKDAQNHFCVKANSYWVLLDTDTHRPLRVTEADAAIYGQGEAPLEMDYAPRKIPVPKDHCLEGNPVRVQKCHLDTNKHMNNCYYVQLALEYLPEDFVLGQIRVEYKNSAVYGDEIVPYYCVEDTGVTVVLKNHEDGKVFALVSLERRKQ